MSNDPFTTRSRLRSTPIPSLDAPPLTPAQFAGGCGGSAPPTQTAEQVAAQYATMFTAATARRSHAWWWLLIFVAVLAPLAIGGYVAVRTMRAVERVTDTSPRIPGGAADLFDQGASATVLDALERDLPGDPTSFTQLVIYPDHAVGSALDGRSVVGRLWRQGSVRQWPGTPVDDAAAGFTREDVRPSAIAAAVAAAPSALADPAAVAAYVIVERSRTDPLRPVQISVYVDGGQHYVSADAEGTVLATH